MTYKSNIWPVCACSSLQLSQFLIRATTMVISFVQAIYTSPFQSKLTDPISCLLPKSMFPSNARLLFLPKASSFNNVNSRNLSANATTIIQASLLESPLLYAGRLCIFYALLKAGLAGSKSNPFVSSLDGVDGVETDESGDLGFSKWIHSIQGKPTAENVAADKRKLVSKWHPTTKGTLRRNYRIPSKSEGRRLLKAIASLLSDDDLFTDAASHKGCQIRRESAHGESVCCNNVRALFDELPTPHVIVEITPFPAGPLTENDYIKAEKLERILRSGPSI